MSKNYRLISMIVALAVIVLGATSMVSAQSSITSIATSVSITSSTGNFGRVTMAQGMCMWTFAPNSRSISLASNQPFSVQAANKGVTTVDLVGGVVEATQQSGFGQSGYVVNIGNMPQSVNFVDTVVITSGSHVVIRSANTDLVHILTGTNQCAVVPAQSLTGVQLNSELPFTVDAGTFDPATQAMVASQSPMESEDVGSFGAPAYSLPIGDLPLANGVNSMVFGAYTPVAVNPQFGVPASATPVPAQGGGAVPGVVATLAPQVMPTVANQWTFTNNPASTNASQATWQAQLTGRGILNPQAFVGHTPADNIQSINFVAAQHGMTIPSGDHTYGEQDSYLDIYSAGRSIRYISADYNVPALGVECHQQNGVGCLLLIVNSGDVAVTFRDQTVYNGFSFEGEYFHGGHVGDAVWGLASYGVLHMLNLEGGTNPGSNCALADGCSGVLVTVVGHSGGVIEWTGRYLYQF